MLENKLTFKDIDKIMTYVQEKHMSKEPRFKYKKIFTKHSLEGDLNYYVFLDRNYTKIPMKILIPVDCNVIVLIRCISHYYRNVEALYKQKRLNAV